MRRLTPLVLVLLASPAVAKEGKPPAAAAPKVAGKHEPGSPAAVEAAMRLYKEAEGLSDSGHIAGAIDSALEAARLAPGAPAPRDLLGRLFLKIGDCAEATAWLGEFVRLGRNIKAVAKASKLIEMCATDKKRQGTLTIETTPPTAAVRVLSRASKTPVAAGKGKVEAILPAGTYRIQATHPGYLPFEEAVRVPARGTARAAPSLDRKPPVLEVRTHPAGAQVQVDGEPVGTAPVSLEGISPGDHEVTAELERYRPARARVSIREGQTVRLELRPEPAPAKLKVLADVEEAAVELEGVSKGRVPVEVEIPPGRRRQLRVLAQGYVPAVKDVLPEPGEVGEVRFTLEEEPATLARRARNTWGTVLSGAGGLLLAGGVVALVASLGTADDADAAYARYGAAPTGTAARASFDEAASLDGRAETELLVAGSLLGTGTVLALWGGWQFLSGP